MAESSINIESYTEDGFWGKVGKFCKDIGKDSLEQVFRLYYAFESEKCSAKHKTIIYGALAYLVSPIDIIPDLTPFWGIPTTWDIPLRWLLWLFALMTL